MASKKVPPPPSKEEMLSLAPPEMQEKLLEAQKLHNELNEKLNDFQKISHEKSIFAAKEATNLKKDLLELKKLSTSVTTNGNDKQLQEKIDVINKKVENYAKTAMEEQMEAATRFQRLMIDIKNIVGKMVKLIDTFDIPGDEKEKMKKQILEFQSLAESKAKEADNIAKDMSTMLSKQKNQEPKKMTKEDLANKIDDLLTKLDATTLCGKSNDCKLN